MSTLGALLAHLESLGLASVQLSGDNGARAVVVPELGAKVLGAGLDDENLLWVPDEISPGGWCVGGQRTWVAPELGPHGFFGQTEETWTVPSELDPGGYVLAAGRRAAGGRGAGPGAASEGRGPGAAPPASGRSSCSCSSRMVLRRADGATFPLELRRQIALLPAPQSVSVPALRLRVRHSLANRGERTLQREVGLWGILQVPSERAGTILVPLRRGVGSALRGDRGTPRGDGSTLPRPYFGELPADWLRRAPGVLALRALAGRRWKVGFSPAGVRGLLAVLRPSRQGPAWLLVVQKCAVETAGTYVDGPLLEPDAPGDVLQAYNHPDRALAFSELECHAPARVLPPGGRQTAAVEYLLAKGPRAELLAAAASLLGESVAPLLFD
jgi:hypothetical protein